MLRTTIGLSFILVLGGLAACSSKSTSDDNTPGGNGSIVGGSGNSGGTPSAGTPSTPNTSGGTTAVAGTTSTGGIGGGCNSVPTTCADATHAMGCNTTTGVVDTFSCIDEYAAIGFVSTGCSADATGEEGCDVTDVKDVGCQMGATAYAFCANATTDDELFNIYVNCFQDYMGAHTIVPCFAQYVSETMTTAADCDNAVTACFGEGGAGPVDMGGGGAGGAP